LINNPNWRNGERFSYEIRHKDSLLGRMDYLITDTLFEKNQAYQIRAITSIGYQGQNTYDSVSLIVRRTNLRPLYSYRSLITPQMALKFQARYLSDKVNVRLDSPQGKKETDIDFPKDGYDNDEITLILRALNLRPGAKYKFQDVSPMSITSYAVEVNVLQPEKVKTPLGEYLCNKVKMKVAGKEAEIWYQKDKPNHMVKYADLQAGTVMLLKALK
jgi:hypothetical protein